MDTSQNKLAHRGSAVEQWGQRLLALARDRVNAAFVDAAPTSLPQSPGGVPKSSSGVFVTIRRVDGALRGCVGTQQHVDDIPSTVARVATLAAFRDPRFPPVKPEEMAELVFELSLLGPTETVHSAHELDTARYGVTIADDDGHYALLLPAIPGIDTVERQLFEVRRKARIPEEATVRMSRFEVRKFAED